MHKYDRVEENKLLAGGTTFSESFKENIQEKIGQQNMILVQQIRAKLHKNKR